MKFILCNNKNNVGYCFFIVRFVFDILPKLDNL